MTHDSGDSGSTGGDAEVTNVDESSHDHYQVDSHNHHDEDQNGHHHNHGNSHTIERSPPNYGSINVPSTRFTARRWDTYSSNATNATNATYATTEINEEEDAWDRKIQNCVKVVFGLLFIGVLVCVFMAYQEGHGPEYGEYPPEWVE